jgi:hypothetical protein
MRGLDPTQLRQFVIRPALESIGLWSPAAENLVLGTALVESKAAYVRQVKGPAISIFQIEPATYKDLLRWLKERPDLEHKVMVLRSGMYPVADSVFEMQGNLCYAAAMCRVFYRRIPQELPGPANSLGMAKYWKVFYNTLLGKGTIEKAEPFFALACSAETGAEV